MHECIQCGVLTNSDYCSIECADFAEYMMSRKCVQVNHIPDENTWNTYTNFMREKTEEGEALEGRVGFSW